MRAGDRDDIVKLKVEPPDFLYFEKAADSNNRTCTLRLTNLSSDDIAFRVKSSAVSHHLEKRRLSPRLPPWAASRPNSIPKDCIISPGKGTLHGGENLDVLIVICKKPEMDDIFFLVEAVSFAKGGDLSFDVWDTRPRKVFNFSSAIPEDTVNDPMWIVCDGLPSDEGRTLSINHRGISTVQGMMKACMSNPDCMGFAYWPDRGAWYPKQAGSGFDPDTATFSQWRVDETWQWYYIRERAQVRHLATPGTPPALATTGDHAKAFHEWDLVITRERIVSNTKEPFIIGEGMCGEIRKIGQDGDILIKFECHQQLAWIKQQDSEQVLRQVARDSFATVPHAVLCGLPNKVSFVAAGECHTAGLTSSGRIVAWGKDDGGQCSKVPTLARGEVFTAVAAGSCHTAGLTSNGRILVWGKNDAEQCSNVPVLCPPEVFIAVAAKQQHTVGLTSAGRILSWGRDQCGEHSKVPAPAQAEVYTAVATGTRHTIGLTSTGRILAWGSDEDGQCSKVPSVAGKEVFTAVAAGSYHSASLTSAGRILAWGMDEFGQCSNVPAFAGAEVFTAVAAGSHHTVGLTSTGRILAWGWDDDGQCSKVPSVAGEEVFTAVAAGSVHTAGLTSTGRILTSKGHILAWGSNTFGPCRSLPTLKCGESFGTNPEWLSALDASQLGFEQKVLHLAFWLQNPDRLARELSTAIVIECASMLLQINRASCEAISFLHICAQNGALQACRALVNAGARVRRKDTTGKSPCELAYDAGNNDVVDFLTSVSTIATMREGSGSAKEVALADTRLVKKVEWFALQMPGMAGLIGVQHSLLAITVGVASQLQHGQQECGLGLHTYTIEKAQEPEDEEARKQFENGVFVSEWTEVTASIEADPLHVLSYDDVQCNISMKMLYDAAVQTGPYDVATANCHHVALKLYNLCAVPRAHVGLLPNEELSMAARVLSLYTDFATSHASQCQDPSEAASDQTPPSKRKSRRSKSGGSVSCQSTLDSGQSTSRLSIMGNDPIDASEEHGAHEFTLDAVTGPTYCIKCKTFLWGVRQFRCQHCETWFCTTCANQGGTCWKKHTLLSRMLGIRLDWVLQDFPYAEQFQVVQKCVFDMNFHEMAPIVAYGDHAYGKGKPCPRDGRDDCSIVDAVWDLGYSGKSTVFLSWVWEYPLKTVLSSLQQWRSVHEDSVPVDRSFIWWCFFQNNQFRILGNLHIQPTEALAEVFGRQLQRAGRLLSMMDRIDDSIYIKRIWCVFELYIAQKHDIPIEVILPGESTLELDQICRDGISRLREVVCINVANAKATSAEDEKGIKLLIEEQSSYEEVNRLAAGALRQSLDRMIHDDPKTIVEQDGHLGFIRSIACYCFVRKRKRHADPNWSALSACFCAKGCAGCLSFLTNR